MGKSSAEVIKFPRQNLVESDILRAPTEPLRPWLMNACSRLNDLIFVEAYDLAYQRGVLNPNDPPVVRLGTELEFLLFSDQFDTSVHQYVHSYDADSERNRRLIAQNPNYSAAHGIKVLNFLELARKSRFEGGLGDILQNQLNGGGDAGMESMGRILAEMRLKPTNAAGYMKNVERVEEFMRKNGAVMGIRPMILANHLHMSLTDSQGSENLLEMDDVMSSVRRGVIDAYHRLLPLSRLPEEIEFSYRSRANVAKLNGQGSYGAVGPRRVEGRMNSTEYMYDPYLTLFVNLLGMYRGLRCVSDPYAIDRDYPLHEEEGNITFDLGDYDMHVDRLLEDGVLERQLGSDVVQVLQETFRSYWDISTGKKSVSEVRARTEALVEELQARKPLPYTTLIAA